MCFLCLSVCLSNLEEWHTLENGNSVLFVLSCFFRVSHVQKRIHRKVQNGFSYDQKQLATVLDFREMVQNSNPFQPVLDLKAHGVSSLALVDDTTDLFLDLWMTPIERGLLFQESQGCGLALPLVGGVPVAVPLSYFKPV